MIKKLLITLFVSTILISCVKERDLSQNTVIAHITIQPDGLHPFNDNSVMRSYIFNYTQKTLLKLDLVSLEYTPILIKEMPKVSSDNLSFSYEIKEGIFWDDGSPLTAKDVVFSTKLMLFSENLLQMSLFLKAVYKFSLTFLQIVSSLSTNLLKIFSETVYFC